MAVYQMYVRNRTTGAMRMIGTADAANPRDFFMKQLLGVDETTDDVYVGQVTSFDAATGNATVTFKKVNVSVQVAP